MTDQYHLNQVSRSFAVSIQALSQPLRDYVGLSYLLCRVVDTVEDAEWEDSQRQARAFELFEGFLLAPPHANDFAEFQQSFPSNLCNEERELIDDSEQLFQRYHSLPQDIMQCLQKSILSMKRGMEFFILRDLKQLRLKSLTELNQYCFFVAGVVGELLNGLAQKMMVLRTQLESSDQNSFSLVKAYHFALFLQKINILKDQKADEKSGRFLLPQVDAVWLQLEKHAEQAFSYIEDLPLQLYDFKLFCSWALFLGLNSLQDLLSDSGSVRSKMTREQALQLFEHLRQIVAEEGSLRSYYQQLKSEFVLQLEKMIPNHAQISLMDPFSEKSAFSPIAHFYCGDLRKADWVQLDL